MLLLRIQNCNLVYQFFEMGGFSFKKKEGPQKLK